MYDFHNDSLPETFNTFFFPVNQRHITIKPDLLQDHRTPFPILELITENSTSDILCESVE